MTDYTLIGTRMPRVDSRAKVMGKARYTADLKLPGMLVGKILRSPYAHARIVSIDTSKALALPGVKAVVTGADTEGVKWGGICLYKGPAVHPDGKGEIRRR